MKTARTEKRVVCDTIPALFTFAMDENNSEDFSFDARTTSQQFQQRLLAAQQSSTERQIKESIVSGAMRWVKRRRHKGYWSTR